MKSLMLFELGLRGASFYGVSVQRERVDCSCLYTYKCPKFLRVLIMLDKANKENY